MLAAIIWFIVFYLLYKFLFGFVIPVVLATRNVRAKMRNMGTEANFETSQQDQYQNTSQQKGTSASQSKAGDYIDFEEIK